jgi:hypothetical protein
MKTAVVFLSKQPSLETLKFADEVYDKSKFDVFIVVDDEKYVLPLLSKKHVAYSVEDEECQKHHYVGCNIAKGHTHIAKDVIAWDKFLFLFCEVLTSYDFVWVFEDDVFIPFVNTIAKLHDNYSNNDLVVPNNFHKIDGVMDWHWKSIMESIKPPYFYSMVCAMGISRRLLSKVREYKKQNNKLFHIEAMFNTIAMQNKFNVISPLELKSIVWMGQWRIDEFLLLPNNVFHPLKETSEHPDYRKRIIEYSKNGYKPQNMLPQFIIDAM